MDASGRMSDRFSPRCSASGPVVSDNPGRLLYVYPFWLIVDCAIPDRIDTIPHSRHYFGFIKLW